MVLIKRIFAALITCCASLPLFAGWGDVNMTPGVNALSREIFDLHMTIFWICVVIGALVLGFMVYLIVAFRKKEGDKPAQFDDHPVLEMTWTVLFAVILAVMAIPATFTMIRAYDDAEGDINILITGHQWKWQYEYLEDEVSFFQ
jgi:cytochrome c oxidase subunit 2